MIIRVCLLCGCRDDDAAPELAEEEGDSAAAPSSESGYKTSNFLIHIIAGCVGRQSGLNGRLPPRSLQSNH